MKANAQLINLDITNDINSLKQIVKVARGDSASRPVSARICDSGVFRDDLNIENVQLYVESLTSDPPTYVEGLTILNGICDFEIPASATASSGQKNAALRIVEGDEVLCTMPFVLICIKSPYSSDALLGTDKGDVLERLVKTASDAADSAKGYAGDAEDYANDAMNSATAAADKAREAADSAETAKKELQGHNESLEAHADIRRTVEDLRTKVESGMDTGELNGRVSDLEDKMAELLYEPISITLFNHDAGIQEIGSTVSSVTLSWKTNKTPTALTLDGESIDVNATSKKISGLSIESDTTWTLVATDEKGSVSKKTTITFCNGIYYGVGSQESNFDSAFVIGLTKKLQTGKAYDFTVKPDNQYIYYAVPKSRGAVTFRVGGFEGGFETPEIVSVINSSEYEEDYYVYRSTNKISGSTSVDVT